MKDFLSLYTSVVITEEYNVMVNNGELIGTTEYRTLYMRCRINRCRYKRVRLYLYLGLFTSEALLVGSTHAILWLNCLQNLQMITMPVSFSEGHIMLVVEKRLYRRILGVEETHRKAHSIDKPSTTNPT